ncbi:hypothetical protein [Rodentibacter ratti]|uniref:hypothetical protein n=1 Tax=Rodentibacter ratti TaxID=1906745 RepID=UPI0015C36E57|nr:hypothetical protein [Rodentibacter ratti]
MDEKQLNVNPLFNQPALHRIAGFCLKNFAKNNRTFGVILEGYCYDRARHYF